MLLDELAQAGLIGAARITGQMLAVCVEQYQLPEPYGMFLGKSLPLGGVEVGDQKQHRRIVGLVRGHDTARL